LATLNVPKTAPSLLLGDHEFGEKLNLGSLDARLSFHVQPAWFLLATLQCNDPSQKRKKRLLLFYLLAFITYMISADESSRGTT